MADFKTTVALEIGAQSVTMAVFTPTGRGFALSRYARRDIVLDPVEEGMRMDYVSNAIGELVNELRVTGKDVHNVVSGQQVFMRFIKLPALDVDDLAEQVGYEAQQHIPFPLEDIVYSYQELPDRGEGEREVLLVAIKKDVLDNLNNQVEGNHLRTRTVDCSITSLYNAFRVSYPDETEPIMILDIGAKTTDIIFSEAGRFFTRSVTAAGSFVTNSIAREFNMNFREAEKFKIAMGVVSLGNGHTDGMPEQEAALATTIRNAMSRLSSEVQRTINHYRAQYKGSLPVKAYICGGGSKIPYAVEFLSSSLNIPVEYLNPISAFSIGNRVDEQALAMDALCLGSVAGAAITGAGVGEFGIDLVPTSVGKERAEKKLIPKVVAAGAIALAGAGFYAYAANAAANRAESALAGEAKRDEALALMNERVAKAENKYKSSEKAIDALSALYGMRAAYVDVMKQISARAASVKFWITEFSPLINYTVNDTELSEGSDVKGVRLIDMRRSVSASHETAISAPPDDGPKGRAAKDPVVTAFFVKGFLLKRPNDENRADIRELVSVKLGERNPDSLFDFKEQTLQNNQNHYYLCFNTKDSKNKRTDYAETFEMILPLKTPIAIPELSNTK